MTADERWLRDRMATVVASVEPPPDLAARAEGTAGRIRRRRWGAGAAVAALAAAVPVVLGGLPGPDRGLPAGPPDPACVPSARVLPDQPDAVAAADVRWPYRGDPALRPALDRVMADSTAAATRPLYAGRLARPAGSAVFVFASQRGTGTPWLVQAAVLPADPSPGSLGGAGAAARLPRLVRDAQVSVLAPAAGARGPVPPTGWDRDGNVLVALAAPGADRVDYRACYRGRPFEVSGRGDVLVREVGPVDAPGRLQVFDGGRLLAAGEVGDPVFGGAAVVRPAVEPVPVPAGSREVRRLAGQGRPGLPEPVTATVPAATLLARCRGPVPLEVLDGDRSLGRVPCDEQVHVLADRVPLASDGFLTVRGVPELRGGPEVRVPYDVVVVTAG